MMMFILGCWCGCFLTFALIAILWMGKHADAKITRELGKDRKEW